MKAICIFNLAAFREVASNILLFKVMNYDEEFYIVTDNRMSLDALYKKIFFPKENSGIALITTNIDKAETFIKERINNYIFPIDKELGEAALKGLIENCAKEKYEK